MKIVVGILGLLPCAVTFAQTYSVSGVVTNGLTGIPLKKADVVLLPEKSEKEFRFLTGADGQFQFQVPEGKYGLSAAAPGFARQGFGGVSKPVEIGVSLYVRAGQDTTHLPMRLFPGAAIRGKISDQNSEPVESAMVQLFRLATVQGRKQVVFAREQYTNDLGEYAFGNLIAGTYYLAASGTPWYAKRGMPMEKSDPDAYRTAYYPGVANAAAAAPLAIAFGQEVRADLALSIVRGQSVNVSCKGNCPARLLAQIFSEGVGGISVYQPVMSLYSPGPAHFGSVPPGHYKVRLRLPQGGQGYLGMSEIDVTNGDVNVTVTASESSVISGDITLEGIDRSLLPRMALRYHSLDDPREWFSKNINADGSFSSPPLTPGRYQIVGTGIANAYLKTVLVGEVETATVAMPAEGVKNVKIAISGRPFRLKGTVLQGGKPVFGALVSLSRAGAGRDDFEAFHGFQTDSDGSFYFDTLAPGTYRLFAVSDGSFEYSNLEALKPYLAEARVIEAGAGDSFTEKIEVMSVKP